MFVAIVHRCYRHTTSSNARDLQTRSYSPRTPPAPPFDHVTKLSSALARAGNSLPSRGENKTVRSVVRRATWRRTTPTPSSRHPTAARCDAEVQRGPPASSLNERRR
ncbi:hypothetical protein C0Q70_08568 [Pomacea canaliculata]|uniref:Uncharacterized protein n=1 Tax=Pomacea canaliculata TaxID=400727 RepID=A0A2T7PI78_POMCA|nr:hypothetical protein C0Q70_08568 [Pomacea canaliculata]